LFPAGTAADFRYAELLPLLRHADACAVNKTVSIAHWNPKEFKCFHQRARAVLQQRCTTSLIAEHV
jgi:DNA topoisomerase VI subunit B